MVRLALITLLLCVSLLAVFRAPTYHLWLLAVGVSAFAWVFCVVILLLLAIGLRPGSYRLAGSILGMTALLLFLSPIVRAYIMAGRLQRDMAAALGTRETPASPFSYLRMLTGVHAQQVPYRTYTYSKALQLDLYPSQLPGKRPCVIVIHGGSWSSGNSRQLPELNSYLARAGYHVASVNYRLAPAYRSPAPVEDVQAAIDYLRRHADTFRIDTGRLVLLGRSAGAQIALLAAYRQPVAGLKGVIDFYGPADMVFGYSLPANPWVLDSRKVLEDYLGGPYSAVPQRYRESSPIEYVNRTSVPTLILHGENDVLVAYEHSVRLNRKLANNGVRHFFLSIPWATHGFDYNLDSPGGQLAAYAVMCFLENVTGEQTKEH